MGNILNKLYREAFLNASGRGDTEIVREYLEGGQDVDARDEYGMTALHWASKEGHVEVVKLLLEAQCNKDAQTKIGWTALHFASREGHVKVVKLLLESQCNKEAQDKDGRTSLHFASSLGRTPWHHASRQGHVEFVKLLLGANCSLDVIDKNGQMPLHIAIANTGQSGFTRRIYEDTLGVLQALVASGAKWDEKCEMMISSGEALPEAPALKLCIDLWGRERKNHASLTEIPLQTIQRGVDATQTYMTELLKSKLRVFRSKLGIIGASNSGKTSFSKSIITLMSSLEHIDNRTVAIDHYRHLFKHAGKSYEFTIWDFAGQDVYQPVHAMFFTRRTIYILCIDMHSYGVALKQATLLADYDSQVDHFMDEVVDKKILKWIRLIIARQTDAEFVFVTTKADKADANSRHAKAAQSDLEKRLKQYVSQTGQELQQALNEAQKPDGIHRKTKETHGFSAKQLKKLQATIKRLLQHEWVSASCVDAESIKAARMKIEEIVVSSNCSFLMPESYVAALEFVRSVRSQSPSRDALSRVQSTFVNVDEFVKRLHDNRRNVNNRPDIDIDTYKEILRTLHDLGDVLWYEDLGIERLKREVILDPMLLIDFIRPIADHKFKSEVMPHITLKTFPPWLHLNENLMVTMKKLLREFNLVHVPRQQVIKWDSDLIVPASWRSNIPASLRFGGQSLMFEFTEMAREGQSRNNLSEPLPISVNVWWEYHFKSLLPESVFDQIVIASFNSLDERQVGPDWILHQKKGVFACRLVISRHSITKERIIRLEAVGIDPHDQQSELWSLFERLCEALERVLVRFRGLTTSRHVFRGLDDAQNLDHVVDDWKAMKPAHRKIVSWLPPTLDWYVDLRDEIDPVE